jgi:hypothetical protein
MSTLGFLSLTSVYDHAVLTTDLDLCMRRIDELIHPLEQSQRGEPRGISTVAPQA